MKNLIIASVCILLSACATVPITGRKQFNTLPASQMNSMALQQYSDFISQNKLSNDTKQSQTLKAVGSRLSKAVEEFFRANNMESEISKYNWEFNLVEDDQLNAWCMPGGKVVFYTGIMPVCKTETGIAVVMGHEIAHAIAKHGAERMSQGLLQQAGSIGADMLNQQVSKNPEQTKALVQGAYALGTQYGAVLPFSRLHESEADKIGLVIMAMAGYNPREAVEFWKRMAAQSKGNAPKEFMSTHPSNTTRINDLKAYMPEALKHYKK